MPTDEARERVSKLAGAGESHETIAIALGIARQTLETYYPVELSVGAHEKRAAVIERLYDAALAGSVAAAREYLKITPKLAAPPEDLDTPVGKKEQANKDAVTAHQGTGWEHLLDNPSVQ